MSNVIRETLIESKIQVLEKMAKYVADEIKIYEQMLKEEK